MKIELGRESDAKIKDVSDLHTQIVLNNISMLCIEICLGREVELRMCPSLILPFSKLVLQQDLSDSSVLPIPLGRCPL